MKIHIDDSKTLEDVKNEFSGVFPYLKIEFFEKAHSDGAGSPKSELIDENLSIGNIRTQHNEGEVEINAEMAVGEVERRFEENYGIHVQVFRKSGDIWLETSATDDWSLADQNETGKEMS